MQKNQTLHWEVLLLTVTVGEFLGSLMVRTQGFHCHSPGSIQGTKTKQAERQPKQTNKNPNKKKNKTVQLDINIWKYV